MALQFHSPVILDIGLMNKNLLPVQIQEAGMALFPGVTKVRKTTYQLLSVK